MRTPFRDGGQLEGDCIPTPEKGNSGITSQQDFNTEELKQFGVATFSLVLRCCSLFAKSHLRFSGHPSFLRSPTISVSQASGCALTPPLGSLAPLPAARFETWCKGTDVQALGIKRAPPRGHVLKSKMSACVVEVHFTVTTPTLGNSWISQERGLARSVEALPFSLPPSIHFLLVSGDAGQVASLSRGARHHSRGGGIYTPSSS